MLISAAPVITLFFMIQPAYGYPTFIDQAVPAKWTDLYFSICVNNIADSRYEKLFEKAIEQWRSAWPNFDYVIHENQDGCDIDVSITKDSVGLPKKQHSQGTTVLGYWQGNHITSADITIPTQNKEEVGQGNYCCKELIYEISEKKFYLIALHEFGHALGLAHAEDDGEEPFDVMTAMGEHNRYVVSAVAVNTLNSIYGKSSKASDHPVTVVPSVTVELEMDKDAYVFDDSVKVSGKVSKAGGAGKIMLLKLLDGSPSMSLNTFADLIPNKDGSFAVDMDLKTDQSGEWMLLVQYLGVSKSMLFDVEEIPYKAFAQTDKTSYSVGDRVKINGNVTRYEDKISIDIINPTGINFAHTVAPISSKKFNAEFILSQSKFTTEGQWTVRLTYADRTDKYTFNVVKPDQQQIKQTEDLRQGIKAKVKTVNVQAKRIGDLVIIHVKNIEDARLDAYGFKVSMPDSTVKAFKAPKEWNKRNLLLDGSTISALFDSHIDKAYFLLKVDGIKSQMNWILHDLQKNTLAEGSVNL
ncbi:MAG: matrixin family metalloprotease [Nitrososphaerales archaeon]